MATPLNRTDFSNYILERLGGGVIRINVSPAQVDHAVDDALDFWQEYHEAAEERTYLSIQLDQAAIDTGAVTLPTNVKSVRKVIDPNVFGGKTSADSLFSVNYYMGSNAVWNMLSGSTNGGMVSYAISQQYMAELDALMSPDPSFRFRHYNGVLHIDKKLSGMLAVGQYLVVECQATLDPASNPRIWSDRYLRNLAVAYLKFQWGSNISKFQNIQLPSGLVMNGSELVAQAKEDIAKAEQDIRLHMEPLGIIVA
jgi:hypothetical protein